MKIPGGQRQFLIAIVTLFTPALANAETTYVVAAGLIDTLNEKYIENPVVEIEGHRIVSVTENGSAPNGAAVIDLSDSTLVPGLADVHAHLGWYASDTNYSFLGVSHTDEAVRSVINAKVLLNAGFTMVRSTGSNGYADVSVRNAVDEGRIPGPRLKVSGPSASPAVIATRICLPRNGK